MICNLKIPEKLFFQLVKSVFKVFIGKNTIKHRICAEDTGRMFNILNEWFRNLEQITPNEIDEMTKDWEVISTEAVQNKSIK